MKIIDIIFALICGKVLGWVIFDFLRDYGLDIGIYKWFLPWVLPFVSLFCLWLAYLLGKKLLFVFQAAKFVLVGILATIVDLEIFEFSMWLLSMASLSIGYMAPKAISFIIATIAKYWGNKFWAFEKNEREGMKKEFIQFFAITLAGLLIDLASFYYFVNITGPQLEIPNDLWVKLSVVLAAIVAGAWNFLGYKFLVFKK